MNSKVSVIVPVYNCEKMVDRSLERLTHQTLKDIEIVCVNDGSTDGSLEVLEAWAKKDKRIKIVSQKNGGLSAARNTGIANASSPFLMFCDADDEFDDRMCEIMVRAIEQEEVDIVACGTEVKYDAHSEIAESDRNYYRIKFSGRNYINETITAKTDVSVCDKLFKTEIVKKYKIAFPYKLNNEDYYFYNAYMSVAKTIFFVNQKLYTYIRHEDSIMSENFDKHSYSPDHLLIAKELFGFYKDHGFLEKHTDFFWNQFSESYWFSYEHSARKFHGKIHKIAKEFIVKNIRQYPISNPKTRKKIFIILRNDLPHKIMRGVKGRMSRVYRKVNVAYKQQDFINKNIEQMEQNIYEMSERVDKIEGGKKWK